MAKLHLRAHSETAQTASTSDHLSEPSAVSGTRTHVQSAFTPRAQPDPRSTHASGGPHSGMTQGSSVVRTRVARVSRPVDAEGVADQDEPADATGHPASAPPFIQRNNHRAVRVL